jgi:hypothetical protein
MAMKKLTAHRLRSRDIIMPLRGQPVVETRIKIPLIFPRVVFV